MEIRGLVESFQSEEGNKRVIPFDPRRWHATRQWSGNRLVLAVYNVRGLEKINSFDKEIVERLGFQLRQDSSIVEAPKIRKLLGNEGGEVQEPQQVEVELEPRETVLHIRMTVQEWNVTSARHGPDHFIEGMAERWEQINLEVDDLNSVIPAVIIKDIGRDWAQEPRLVLVDDQGEELHLGRMLGMSTIRVPNFEPGGMSSDWLKVCKVHNTVRNVEEVIVLWIHRRIALHPVESDEPRADGGDPPVPEMDFRGGIPRLAMMCARDVNDLMKFVEVAEGETSEEDDVCLMKAAPENIYTPNIEDIISKVSPESPLKVTHTVDPRISCGCLGSCDGSRACSLRQDGRDKKVQGSRIQTWSLFLANLCLQSNQDWSLARSEERSDVSPVETSLVSPRRNWEMYIQRVQR